MPTAPPQVLIERDHHLTEVARKMLGGDVDGAGHQGAELLQVRSGLERGPSSIEEAEITLSYVLLAFRQRGGLPCQFHLVLAFAEPVGQGHVFIVGQCEIPFYR